MFSRLFKLIFCPVRCAFCGRVIKPEQKLCKACNNSVLPLTSERCPLCGCEKIFCTCRKKKHEYTAVCAPFYYDLSVRRGIHRLKFKNATSGIDFFANSMCIAIKHSFPDIKFDLIVSVPIHKSTMQKRGYNQSELVAEALSEKINVIFDKNILVKTVKTKEQKNLPFNRRKGNVAGVFEVKNQIINNKTILLVDDVKTSGSTVDECAKMLLINGAKSVYVCTLAVVRREKAKHIYK